MYHMDKGHIILGCSNIILKFVDQRRSAIRTRPSGSDNPLYVTGEAPAGAATARAGAVPHTLAYGARRESTHPCVMLRFLGCAYGGVSHSSWLWRMMSTYRVHARFDGLSFRV